MKYAFFKEKIVPFEDAKISIATHAFNYGTAVFEGIRGYYNKDKKKLYLLKLREHYNRILNSAKILMMYPKYSAEDLCNITLELVKKHDYKEDCYIRPVIYKSDAGIGVKLHDLKCDVSVFTTPFGKYIEIEKGIKVKTSSWRRIDETMIPGRAKPCGAYVNSALAKTEAILNGADEALMLNADGHVSEGSAENIFVYKNNEMLTPPANANILEGITRDIIIELLKKEFNIEVKQRNIDRTELYVADEVFMCGTGAQISPVIELDNRAIGNGEIGEITKKLQTMYLDIVRGNNERYKHWITEV